MPWSAKVLPLTPIASANLSGATGWPTAAQISPLLCMVARGSTAICMMPGISAERRGLLFIGALIDIGGKRPVALSHGARRMTNHSNVEPIQRYRAVAALVDVEDERNVAYALAR